MGSFNYQIIAKSYSSLKVYFLLFSVSFCLLFLSSCAERPPVEVTDVKIAANWQAEKESKKSIELDYTEAFARGFSIPSPKQIADSSFYVEFSIRNNTGMPQKFCYKIFYQNESYKFQEFYKNDTGAVFENKLAAENFYGSWENVSDTFMQTEELADDGEYNKIVSKIRINGNPRNEKKYYGSDRLFDKVIKQEDIDRKTKEIRGNSEWLKSIKIKADINKTSLDKQLELDAKYILEQEGESTLNNRWKRNPRVGYYSFLIVVTTADNLKNGNIPAYIQDISKQNEGAFVNPYYYFLYGPGSKIADAFILKQDSLIKVTARPNLSEGIFQKVYPETDTSSFNALCNGSFKLKRNAAFQQFIHNVAATTKIDNIPVIANLSEYSKTDYYAAQNQYTKGRKSVMVGTTDCPCKTVAYSNSDKALILKNPGNKSNEFKKENVGLITRHGFTYGKFRVKARLSDLLNKHNVWNGITNAVWLMSESLNPWNSRRICSNTGYLPNYTSTKDDARKEYTSYSEIDFEILKASQFWPQTSYKPPLQKPQELASDSANIMVTCTNWDMACPDPPKYDVGVQPFNYMGNTFALHRWDYWYKAITAKLPFPNKELFGSDYYWFEIEWKPEEIIWRIGPEKDKMKVVCYMNNTVTNIPNNQMLLIVTQEYHITKWWPEAPFNQEDIPFPLNDIVGKIYEIEIE